MLVVYDDTGFVQQAIFVGDFAALEKVYQANGAKVLIGDYSGDPMKIYVKDGVIVERPTVQVTGTVRSIKADGVDSLELTVAPANFNLTVLLDNTIVHQEIDTSGAFAFSTTHPGSYTLQIDAAFPYYKTHLTVEAT